MAEALDQARCTHLPRGQRVHREGAARREGLGDRARPPAGQVQRPPQGRRVQGERRVRVPARASSSRSMDPRRTPPPVGRTCSRPTWSGTPTGRGGGSSTTPSTTPRRAEPVSSAHRQGMHRRVRSSDARPRPRRFLTHECCPDRPDPHRGGRRAHCAGRWRSAGRRTPADRAEPAERGVTQTGSNTAGVQAEPDDHQATPGQSGSSGTGYSRLLVERLRHRAAYPASAWHRGPDPARARAPATRPSTVPTATASNFGPAGAVHPARADRRARGPRRPRRRPQVTTEMVTEAARVTAPTSPPHVEPGTVSYVNIPNNYWTESADRAGLGHRARSG